VSRESANSEHPIEVEVELTYTTDVALPADELRDYMAAHKMTDRDKAAKQLAAEARNRERKRSLLWTQ
jgi:hypothetical protein